MMTSLKMWCLLSLTVLLLSITPTQADVVDSMSECKGFFLDNVPPRIKSIIAKGKIQNENRYKVICQTFNDTRRFVTLYDTTNKIPVFSAYKYRGKGQSKKDKKRPDNIPWKIEPKLEDMNNGVNMEDCDDRTVYTNQASDKDYKNLNGYNRGHLFPSSHAFNESDKMSTFTLTNIVPQADTFNSGSWEKMETCVKYILENYCNKQGYVVTGAQPSKDKIPKINTPTVLWSAFCCYSKNKKWIAGAHWGDNIAETSTTKYLEMKTLKELETNFNINAFPGKKCPLKETVAKSNPRITTICQGPLRPLIKSAPPTPSNQQQFIDFLYNNKKLKNICQNYLKKRITIAGPQAKNLNNLCVKLDKDKKLSSDDIDETFKKFLVDLLNKSDS